MADLVTLPASFQQSLGAIPLPRPAPGNPVLSDPAQSWFDAATVIGVIDTVARILE